MDVTQYSAYPAPSRTTYVGVERLHGRGDRVPWKKKQNMEVFFLIFLTGHPEFQVYLSASCVTVAPYVQVKTRTLLERIPRGLGCHAGIKITNGSRGDAGMRGQNDGHQLLKVLSDKL